VDAVEAFTHGINLLREHVKPTVRMHYTITHGGNVPNVVPDYGRVWFWLRDSTRAGVEVVLPRIREIADGAARIAGVDVAVRVQTGCWERLVLSEAGQLLDRNMRALEPIRYSEEEQSFARALQKAAGVPVKGADGSVQPLREQAKDPEGGSTDVGDVSWVTPTLHFNVATAPTGVPWHSWAVVAPGGMSIGHKGMLFAARTIAAAGVDLFEDASLRDRLQSEFATKTAGVAYKGYIPDGPPPVPAK
jgi:aminobenzoyl-glutamate utilization protein B